MIVTTIRKIYEDDEGVQVLFYDKGIKVGEACTVYCNGKPNSFLHGLEVVKQHRNQGIGSAILEYMVDTYDVDTLYVEKDNVAAIGLYEKFGFDIVQEFNENFVVMKKMK